MAQKLENVWIGHATDHKNHTGCSVILLPDGAVGSADVRGPGPGTREIALLAPERPLHRINGVVLTGGSAFGLATADGVVRFLAENGYGYITPIRPVPIVTAAVVFDLFLNQGQFPPDADMGYAACLDANANNEAQGNVGAGAGVTVGKWSGPDHMMKGGFGLAETEIDDLVVKAAVVVNAIGDVVNKDGSVLAGARGVEGEWLASRHPFRFVDFAPSPQMGTNTTLAVVITNARLDKVDAFRLAQRAHDGLAIAIRPTHMTHEGDTAFALATEQVEAPFEKVATAAVEMVAEAIRNAVRFARSIGDIRGLAG
ncbi:MAG: P1 family peptidase [Candidatus Promineifilaceae bacterium]|nr:P1 family peptidase [Candidatus Promineifilaceae bacterium]